METAFSIRNLLHGTLHDFVESSGFRCTETENVVRDLVSFLASYREEDVPLFPDVFLLARPSDLSTLAPGVVFHKIGELPFGPEAAAKLLKNAAGLATDGWAVYAAKLDSTRVEYGVFRSQRHSFATSAEESMQDLGDTVPVLLLRNRGRLTVELLNSKQDQCTITLTSASPAASQLARDIKNLVGAASATVDPDVRERFVPYFSRFLTRILQRCHGALLAVVDDSTTAAPPGLGDGVWIDPIINLAEKHKNAISAENAEALADLQAAESLLVGMVNSDGVVVLGSSGTIRAFRVFLNPSDEEKRSIPDKGGGRRRTFSLLNLRVQAGSLLAAFIRSQDGETDCQRKLQ
jgi:hypothetical protein